MKISEIFYSFQGEGKLAGVPSAFVRTSGCNLRCRWCDSPYALSHADGESLEVDRILDRVAGFTTTHVVVTGGEPMIAPDIAELCRRLKEADYHVTIETAATVFTDVVCDLASISPKLSNSTPRTDHGKAWTDSHERTRLNLDAIRQFMRPPDYQLKFVLDSPDDLAEIDTILARLGPVDPSDVLLMPQGVTIHELNERGRWIAEICKQRGFRFCPRLHIALFGNVRGR